MPTNPSTAMLHMYDSWWNILEEGDFAEVCMMDMSAAFDVVELLTYIFLCIS